MKIQDTNRIGMIQSYQKSSQFTQEKKAPHELKRDQLQISAEAQEKLKLAKEGQTRKARIEELKNQITSGTYKVNAEQIAEKLLAYWNKQQ